MPKIYTIFGRVTDGIETLDRIAAVPVTTAPTGEQSAPLDPPVINSVVIMEQPVSVDQPDPKRARWLDGVAGYLVGTAYNL